MNNGDVVPLDLVDADLEIVENSRKRRRTDQDLPFHSPSPLTEASHEDLPEWHRDEKYYFEDGNIVILAGLELFRVHRSVLSCHSVVLRDMFTVPQPEPTDIEMEDECPLVRLQDNPRVIRWMLEVMYCGLDSNFLDPFKPCSLPKVCALLEIGQKYDVPQIRQNALHRFKLLFPCKLHSWKPHSMRLATARVVLADSCERAQLAKVVEVLRIHGEPEALRLLPLVFYAYCQLSHQDDDEIHPDCQDLAQQDKQICRKAIRQLNAHQLATYSVFCHPDIRETCENYLRCDFIRLRLTHDLLKSRMLSPPCALENMATWCSSQKDWKQLCKPCSKKILSDLEKRRQGVWDDLGHIFNEPNWLEANEAAT